MIVRIMGAPLRPLGVLLGWILLQLPTVAGWGPILPTLDNRGTRRRHSLFAYVPHLPRVQFTDDEDVVVEQAEEEVDEDSAYRILAGNIATCLMASDLKRDDGTDGAATGWTAWIDEPSAYRLQSCLNLIRMPTEDDVSVAWTRWFKATPEPFVMDLSEEIRSLLNATMAEELLERIGTNSNEFLGRISLRLIVLPSGSLLDTPLRAPTGAMVYGKLLYGGATRYRLVGSAKRRAGERLQICSPGEASPGWLQYGGSPRNYAAVDMGPCLIMEIELLPKGPDLAMMGCADPLAQALRSGVMSASGSKMPALHDLLDFAPDVKDEEDEAQLVDSRTSLDVCDLEEYFCTSTGGLRRQIDEIVRRVLDGRVVQPVRDVLLPNSTSTEIDRIRREEMKGLLELGLRPPKGLLLYGPPGCGKTQLAREISTILDARPPKIVAAPELLDRWVGGSEKLIRLLFEDAEVELKMCNGDPTLSALHVVVIDECDAVFRKRTSQEGASEVTRASAVNQILAKLDGVNALENVLLIGMTNRKELLDPALLRPGRLEVHVEIPLPDEEGRREILKIHFEALRKRARLSPPLITAIDGRKSRLPNIGRRWRPIRSRFARRTESTCDLASDYYTKGFSGADLAGLVRCAGSIALGRTRLQDDGSIDSLVLTLEDVLHALNEVKAGHA